MLRSGLGGVSLVNSLLIRLSLLLAVRIRRLSRHLRLLLGIAGACLGRRGELLRMTGGLLGFCLRLPEGDGLLGCMLRACCSLPRILICAVCVLVLFSHGDHSLSLANLALFTLHSITQAL